jgi:hypothetical protein
MKKYIEPAVEVIEMEMSEVVATSTFSVNSDESTTIQLESRNRGAAWTDYEGE